MTDLHRIWYCLTAQMGSPKPHDGQFVDRDLSHPEQYFPGLYDLDIKSKVVSLNGQTLEMFSLYPYQLLGPFNPILATQPYMQVLSKHSMTLTSKVKLFVSMVNHQTYLLTLALLVLWAIKPYFSHLAICKSNMPAYFDLVLKSKVVGLNVQTQDLSSDLNLVSQGAI